MVTRRVSDKSVLALCGCWSQSRIHILRPFLINNNKSRIKVFGQYISGHSFLGCILLNNLFKCLIFSCVISLCRPHSIPLTHLLYLPWACPPFLFTFELFKRLLANSPLQLAPLLLMIYFLILLFLKYLQVHPFLLNLLLLLACQRIMFLSDLGLPNLFQITFRRTISRVLLTPRVIRKEKRITCDHISEIAGASNLCTCY